MKLSCPKMTSSTRQHCDPSHEFIDPLPIALANAQLNANNRSDELDRFRAPQCRWPSAPAIPFHGAPQAFFEIDFGCVAEPRLCPGDIRQRVLDISAAFGPVLRLARIRCWALQSAER